MLIPANAREKALKKLAPLGVFASAVHAPCGSNRALGIMTRSYKTGAENPRQDPAVGSHHPTTDTIEEKGS